MGFPERIYYTEADKALKWDRWQKGESLHAIASHFGLSHTSIRSILARTGGIRPPPRRRSRLALRLTEREEISRGSVAGRSIRWPDLGSGQGDGRPQAVQPGHRYQGLLL